MNRKEMEVMKRAEDLRELLGRIDRRGYPAYKDTAGISFRSIRCRLIMFREIRLPRLQR